MVWPLQPFAAACSRGSSVHTGSPWITSLCWRHFSFRLHSLNFGPVADCVAVVEEVGEAVEDEVFGAGLTLVGQSRCLCLRPRTPSTFAIGPAEAPPCRGSMDIFWPRLHPAGLEEVFFSRCLGCISSVSLLPPSRRRGRSARTSKSF